MNRERMLKVILGPHVSEKTTILAEDNNQVAFKVARDATKGEVKEAVENLFDVQVKNVRILNMKGKVKRSLRGQFRRQSDWKKAYVALEQGHEIDFAELG